MDFETYNARMRTLDEEIIDIKVKIQQLETQISETQSAADSAKLFRREFEYFIDKRKRLMNRPTKGTTLRSFLSFQNKAMSILTGHEYLYANSQIDEMHQLISQKLLKYNENIDYCREELRRLHYQKEMVIYDYNAAMTTLDGEAVT